MMFKAIDGFDLTFEVDLVNMTVVLIKGGKEGKTYDASQYFQYFREYGVRKVDVAQLREHFSIDYFQNMLVTGRNSHSFEFCIQFAPEKYKILQCKMNLIESKNRSIIRIVMEDISHKRVKQLDYIKIHFSQIEHKSEAKLFDIRFEDKNNKSQEKDRIYRGTIAVVSVVCIVLSVLCLRDFYTENTKRAMEDTFGNCKIAEQCIEQQLSSIFLNLTTFNIMIQEGKVGITEPELMEYIEAQKSKYGYTGMAFLNEDNELTYTNSTLQRSNIEISAQRFAKNEDHEDNGFTVIPDYVDGKVYINCILATEGLEIEGMEYKLIAASIDLDSVSRAIFNMGDISKLSTIIINKQGDILWANSPQISPYDSKDNFLQYLEANTVELKNNAKTLQLNKNLAEGKAGTMSFSSNNQKRFLAYTPLSVEGLYVVSLSKPGIMGMETRAFLTFSICLWFMVLIIPLMNMIYHMRKAKLQKKYLEGLAYADEVTGGKNINYFDEKARTMIRDLECQYALVVTNLQNFSLYNEKYGHVRGDEIIRTIFMGVSRCVAEGELMCRAYAEHMLMLLKYEGENQLEERLIHIGKGIIETNFKLEFGVCIIRDLTLDLEVAKERAHMALNNKVNKSISNVMIYYYDVNILEKIILEKELENTMYRAFRNGEFKIFVEPRYHLGTRALCNGDTYAIWNHPERGNVKPEQYVSVLERKGLIMSLDNFIFEEICKRIRSHFDKGRTCLPITIKLHRNHFNVNDFINKFISIKERYDIPGTCICFEISEEIMFESLSEMSGILERIHQMDASCILGDYRGTFLPLEVIYRMEIDEIKFSNTFLDEDLPESMINGLVKIGKSMNAKVIVTGVTTQKQIKFLTEVGCDEAKGDAFAKSISLDEYINIF